MIRINLLPELEREKIEPKGRWELLIGLGAIVAVIVVILITHYSQKNKIEEVERRIRITEKKIQALKDVKEKVEEFKAKNEKLKKRIKVIEELEKKRSGPFYVLNALSDSIPDKAWIDEFSSKGNLATVKGIAWNEFTVADFMESLQRSRYFQNVNLKVIKKTTISNLPLRSFEITSRLNYTGVVERKEERAQEEVVR